MSLQQYEQLGLVNGRFLRMQLSGTDVRGACLDKQRFFTCVAPVLCFSRPQSPTLFNLYGMNDGKRDSARTVMRYVLQRRSRRKRGMYM